MAEPTTTFLSIVSTLILRLNGPVFLPIMEKSLSSLFCDAGKMPYSFEFMITDCKWFIFMVKDTYPGCFVTSMWNDGFHQLTSKAGSPFITGSWTGLDFHLLYQLGLGPCPFSVSFSVCLSLSLTVIRYPSKIGGIDLISPKLFELES